MRIHLQQSDEDAVPLGTDYLDETIEAPAVPLVGEIVYYNRAELRVIGRSWSFDPEPLVHLKLSYERYGTKMGVARDK